MGTGYDCSDVKSHTAAKSITAAQRRWRKKLVLAMARRGFVNYSKEWWHFSLPGAGGQAYDFPIRRGAIDSRIPGPAMSQASFATHEVFNQSPPFEDVDLFAVDRPLVEAVAANGGASAQQELSEFGKHWGSAAMAERGRVANENTPKLRTFDSRGNRRDEVEFHPAYHELMAHSAHAGVHNSTWTAAGQAGRRRVGSGARGEILHGLAGRDRASLPDHHDARLGRGAGRAAGPAGEGDAGAGDTRLRSELSRRGGPSAA